MKKTELITNNDGSIFHLRLKPEHISDKIIIVGDPDRVGLVSSLFDSTECKISNREFHTVTGAYKNKRITVISSGIGTDNIDILINELDAVVNFDLVLKKPLSDRTSLTLIRIGTSGGLQKEIEAGSFLISEKAIGFDGVMNFYKGIESIMDKDFETAFKLHTGWPDRLAAPYVVDSDPSLFVKFSSLGLASGITVSAPGFYAPQGRYLSLEPFDTKINDKLGSFRYGGRKITNYEMESSAIYGLSGLLGHKALTICSVIGNRVTGKFVSDYHGLIEVLSKIVLDHI
ncbi:MAG TPA: nucleoside phosphorylase [Bacteroidales bacterium]|nr:nucleoside phosphorylase [Bacteroidales bacterium]